MPADKKFYIARSFNFDDKTQSHIRVLAGHLGMSVSAYLRFLIATQYDQYIRDQKGLAA